jgi:hypothetical protein
MYIVPYYLVPSTKSEETGFHMWTAWIFLRNGGKDLWETDEKGTVPNKTVIKKYLTENGFAGQCTCVKGDIMYFKVDCSAMKMSDFYKLTDFIGAGKPVPNDIDIWRPFFWVGEERLGEDDAYSWNTEAALAGKFTFVDWKVLRDSE